jgi:hypothetical protein
MKIRKRVTPAKKAANKKNAKNSTGPKSIPGKGRASRNAIRHGMYSRDMLLPGESERELKQLQNEMMSSWCPVGYREVRRVEKLIWNEWRHRRVIRGEAGELGKLLADHDTRAEMAASTHTPQYNQAVADLAHLNQIEEQINSEGRVSQENLDWLRKLPYGDEGRSLWDAIELAQHGEPREGEPASPDKSTAAESQRPPSAENVATSKANREFTRPWLLDLLDCLKETMRREQLHHAEFLIRRAEAQRNALLVPQEALLNRTTRCENHLLGKIECDENALERMQRLRHGEKVPPPSVRVN